VTPSIIGDASKASKTSLSGDRLLGNMAHLLRSQNRLCPPQVQLVTFPRFEWALQDLNLRPQPCEGCCRQRLQAA